MTMSTTTLLPIESLRCYDLVLIAFVMLALDAAVYVWSQRGTQLSPQEAALLKQYNEQVVIVNRLNSVETFVEQSKAIRKMNTVKKQMQELAGALCMDVCAWLWTPFTLLTVAWAWTSTSTDGPWTIIASRAHAERRAIQPPEARHAAANSTSTRVCLLSLYCTMTRTM